MTTPIRDVIASLDTGLDDLRQARSLQAIHRKFDTVDPVAPGAATAAVVWPLAIGAAVASAFAMWLVMRDAPVSARPQMKAPSQESVVSPREPVASEPAARRDQPALQVAGPAPAPVAKRAPARRAIAARAPVHETPSKITANELYRRAESALAMSDRASAREHLERLLVDFPVSPLIDAARYDLALLAVTEHDDARALLQLDQLIASGRDSNIVAAARRLRRTVTQSK